MCFPLLLFSIPLKNMFYNYLIFSMVALSLRIFKKYFVSFLETISSTLGNKIGQAGIDIQKISVLIMNCQYQVAVSSYNNEREALYVRNKHT